MNADGSRGLGVTLSIGARMSHLLGIAIGVLTGGIVLALLAALIIHLAIPKTPDEDT